MFILFGMRSRTTSVDSGRFHCPNEGGDRPYVRLSARRWFTLFFLPVIPLGRGDEWVRCQSCGAEYDVDALSHSAPPAGDQPTTDGWPADGSWPGAESSPQYRQ